VAAYHPGVTPLMLAIAGLVALLVLLPTRRLHLAGWRREALTTYFASVWLLGTVVAAVASPARFLVPILLIAYLAPFVTPRAGLDRLFGRGPSSPPLEPERPPIKDVTPPDARDG
jgi:hypothetical protein